MSWSVAGFPRRIEAVTLEAMSEERRSRRRRGRRGGQRQSDNGAPQQQQPPQGGTPPRSEGRRDTRGTRPADNASGGGSSSVRRSPHTASNDGRQRRDTRGGPRNEPPQRRGPRDQGRPRQQQREMLEMPPPDAVSVELGAAFKEAHQALRDAVKALDKRKAEQGDEPAWLVEQLQAAEARFSESADAWTTHLEKTGRRPMARSR
jgi:hypothetical protein